MIITGRLCYPCLANLQECQAEADKAFILALAVPMALAVAAAAYVARPPPQELVELGQVFEDDTTGFLFEKFDDEMEPERDKDVSTSEMEPENEKRMRVHVDLAGYQITNVALTALGAKS